jgi:tetratricopeptide (TPR) repeat protein
MRKRPAFIEVDTLPAVKGSALQVTAHARRGGTPNRGTTSSLLQRAVELFNANKFAEAADVAEQVLVADPKNVHALRIIGVAARKAKEFSRAGRLLDSAIQLSPAHAVLYFERGLTWLEQNRHREAYECFLQSTRIDPKFQPAFVNVSAILEQQERVEEAMQWARHAADLKPNCFLAQYNLANTLRECGRVSDAIVHYNRAAELSPEYAKARWNLGISHVLLGHFDEAWPLFELREVAEEVKLDKYTQPRWDGSPLTGKTIVVHAEQGVGDEVLFASCFPEVISQAGKTILVCEQRLLKLFARSFPTATVHGWARRKDWSPMPIAEPVDFQIPAGSLPLHFRKSAESFPQRESFLIADSGLVAGWKRRFASLGDGLKIGVSWRAGGKANEGRKRTIPLTKWQEILTAPHVHFVNLQYSDSSDDLAEIKSQFGVQVHDWEQGDPLVDMDSYAAKVAALDLVISVGNAAVHLAGALGTPAWTMLPRVPSWRWMVTGEVSPWYSSVRLFRQPRRREWQPVIRQIAARLRDVSQVAADSATPEMRRQQILAVMPQNEPPEAAPIAVPQNRSDDWLDPNDLGSRQPLQIIQAFQQKADAAIESKDWATAEHAFREILQVTPRHLFAHAGLGRVALETGRTDLAIRSYQRALNVYEPHAVNHAQLAAALLDAERNEEALAHAARAMAIDPKSTIVQLLLARAFQAVQRHSDALAVFELLLHTTPEEVDVIAARCRSLVGVGRLDEALRTLKSHRHLTSDPRLQVALGEALLDDQCFAEAERCFTTAIRLDQNSSAAHFQLARLYDARGDVELAIESCQQAIRSRPEWLSPQVLLTAVLGGNGQLFEAEIACRRALELGPENAELQVALANLLAEQSKHGAAIEMFDRTLDMFPDNAAAQQGRRNSLAAELALQPAAFRLDDPAKIGRPHAAESVRHVNSRASG